MTRQRPGSLFDPAAEDEDTVVPSEAEGVRERHLDLLDAGGVREVVEIAFRVGHGLVDGWRKHTVVQRQYGEDGFDGAGGGSANAQGTSWATALPRAASKA